MNKDFYISLGLTVFLALFGGMIALGFEATAIVASISSLIGALIACLFKESRRGLNEVRPNNFYIPYVIGGAITSILVYFMA